MTVPHDQLVACVEREIAKRERFYPRWVAAGKMTSGLAHRELDLMRAVLAFVKEHAPPPPQVGLFGEKP